MRSAHRKQLARDYGGATVGGLLTFLGFAGFGVWPLAFIAFVPILLIVERTVVPSSPGGASTVERPWRHLFLVTAWYGLVANFGGYYWLVPTMKQFAGFPDPVCVLLAAIVIAYTGGTFVTLCFVYALARRNAVPAALAAAIGVSFSELLYPLLFPFYYGTSFHELPVLLQVADLGGPILVSIVALIVNGAIVDVWIARSAPSPKRALFPVIAAGTYLVFVLAYGALRLGWTDAAVEAAPRVRVGLIQANMGLLEKRNDAMEGVRRHVSQSRELAGKVDLIVWPETAYADWVPPGAEHVPLATAGVNTPMIFGALAARAPANPTPSMLDYEMFNTALLTNREGRIESTYDKTYRLAFAEYLPFGDVFPILYKWSPNSGRFTKGAHTRPLVLARGPNGLQHELRVGTLICYEDVLPGFVRKVMAHKPNLLANITNDAWFGDTHEPHIHMALAKFRAVEHHRYLVRATNSGVSVIVDPSGRVVATSGTFTRENVTGEVRLLEGSSLYELVGDWPGYLAVALVGFFLLKPVFARKRSSKAPAA